VQHNGVATVVGAGPSGLACAITLARAGANVIVREARSNVGARFHGDFQGLENWSSEVDVIEELASYGIEPRFEHIPIRDGTAFDNRGERYEIRCPGPMFYLVRRGSAAGTLDRALYEQAVASGVTVRFNDRVEALDPRQRGAIGAGPRVPGAIAAGYVFSTMMPDGCYMRFDEKLAPGGYSYLLVHGGRGTVAACLFRDFRQEQRYVDLTVAAFERDVGLKMENPKTFGGSGSFFFKHQPYQGPHPVMGELAGLQDALFGFGMRWAIRSGVWAGRALLGLEDLRSRWRRDAARALAAGAANRFLFERLGDAGRRRMLFKLSRTGGDPRIIMRRIYQGTLLTRALAPLARVLERARLRDPSCAHVDCSCVWCREAAAAGMRTL
jgi:flavin-dependent dehydrogenase